jgi:hypothetical protein
VRLFYGNVAIIFTDNKEKEGDSIIPKDNKILGFIFYLDDELKQLNYHKITKISRS